MIYLPILGDSYERVLLPTTSRIDYYCALDGKVYDWRDRWRLGWYWYLNDQRQTIITTDESKKYQMGEW